MKRITAALIALLLLLLPGCAPPVPAGVVISKAHTLPQTYLIWSGQILVPVSQPAIYSITIRGPRSDNSEQATRTVNVDETTFHQVKIGEQYTIDP